MRTRRFDSVWDAIEQSPAAAASLKLRAELTHVILVEIDRRKLTQTCAAAAANVSQPRMSDLMRGRIDLFSLDALIDIAARLGLGTRMTFKRRRVA